MTDLEKDKILLLADSVGKMARELQSIKRLLKEMAYVPQMETETETQNSNLTFEKRTMRDCYNCRRYETEGECVECKFEPKDEPQTERRCVNCKFLTYRFNKTWCDIKCDNPHDEVCDRWTERKE